MLCSSAAQSLALSATYSSRLIFHGCYTLMGILFVLVLPTLLLLNVCLVICFLFIAFTVFSFCGLTHIIYACMHQSLKLADYI